MELFSTDFDRLGFLLESDALMDVDTHVLDAHAEDFALVAEEVPSDKRPKYITNYVGSKQKLVDWIWRNTPENAKSVADAFCGSGVVSYMYKTKGLQVFANDLLQYSFHNARALIENSKVRLGEDDLKMLLTENPKAGTFVRDNFKGIFFYKGVHGVIDNIRANIDKLEGYKKDIALAALGRTCMSGKAGFGHFSVSLVAGKNGDSPEEFKDRFQKTVARMNALIFDNGKECKASRKEVNDFLPGIKADLAYFDPPYATEFSTTNYEKAYHFVEGLMTYWKGLEINKDSKVRNYKTTQETISKGNANSFFETFLGNAKGISNWLISYRDHAHPNEPAMKKILSSLGRDSAMKSKKHNYSISVKNGDASKAIERLFVCKRKSSQSAAADLQTDEGRESKKKVEVLKGDESSSATACCHTSIPVEILVSEDGSLSTQAIDLTNNPDGDPQFSFILCRVGTNKNGDNFSLEELASRYATAINKKVDLKHSQDFTDIVGGVIGADFVEDEEGGRVECVGELYVRDSENARLAYKLMKKGIISQVSMECDYEEGECSVCGKRVKSKKDYCVHLRKFKGREDHGKPIFEILHGVTFSGLGLLDRKGADENARILQVASTDESILDNQQQGGNSMADPEKDKDKKNAEGAKDGGGDSGGGDSGGEDNPTQDKARIQELEKENKDLKQKLMEAQKRLQELEAEQKSAASKAKAEALVSNLEKQGLSFGTDEEKPTEIKRLAEMSDDAFTATEAAFERLPKLPEKNGNDDDAGDDSDKDKQQAKASGRKQGMRSSASHRPNDVDDSKMSLQEKLEKGFMTAYQHRVGVFGSDANQ